MQPAFFGKCLPPVCGLQSRTEVQNPVQEASPTAPEKQDADLSKELERLKQALEEAQTANTQLQLDLERVSKGSSRAKASVDLDEVLMEEEDEDDGLSPHKSKNALSASMARMVSSGLNSAVAKGSALGQSKPVQVVIYAIALGFMIFVLGVSYSMSKSGTLSDHGHGDGHGDDHGSGGHHALACLNGSHGDHHGPSVDQHGIPIDLHDSSVGQHGAPVDHHSASPDDHGVSADQHGAGAGHHGASSAGHNGASSADQHGASSADQHDSDAGHEDSTPGQHDEHANHEASHHGAARRRLGGGVSPLLQNIAFCFFGCGLISFFVNIVQQPLILGYLLGGILVGPHWGLNLVHSHESVAEISSLGLVFLLFMIGLELDVSELLKMGRVVIFTGLLQFPICAFIQVLLFNGIHAAGLSLGTGDYAPMYCGVVCGISSTMIVVKLLGEKGETDRPNGRLTIGILIFQDIWAMVFLAMQSKLDNPEITGLLWNFGMIIVLIFIAMMYAKFVMPAVLYYASRNSELMLVMALAWCFFICCTAHMEFVGIGMELAALIAGVALATFPYSAEFNGKIKYIRDFFIALFFAALGMQIPVPALGPICTAVVLAGFVLLLRWLGICALVWMMGGGARLGALATLNLSQISEFALVICSLGMKYGHIGDDTLTIIIWTFAILAILSSQLIGKNHQIYGRMHVTYLKMRGLSQVDGDDDHGDGECDEEQRDILLLGFHRIASMLIAEFENKTPHMLPKVAVVDYNQAIKHNLEKKGVEFNYGDISSADVLHHAFQGEPRIVVSATPDPMLQSTTNSRILRTAKQVWPEAKLIVTADNPRQAQQLYAEGADYVLRSAKLCAERLHDLLSHHRTDGHSELEQIFSQYKALDKDQSRDHKRRHVSI